MPGQGMLDDVEGKKQEDILRDECNNPSHQFIFVLFLYYFILLINLGINNMNTLYLIKHRRQMI